MRGMIEGIANAHPIVGFLPGMLADDALVQGFAGGLDEVLAPILLALDNLAAYLDPSTAPPDFVEWIAGWVGMALDEDWPIGQQRDFAKLAVDLYEWRGTVRGLIAHVLLYTGVMPEVIESGACEWSPSPNRPLPGAPSPSLVVRLRVPDPRTVDLNRLNRVISTAKPAHIPHRVDLVR